MKERDDCRAYNKRRRHATPPAPVCSPLCLTVCGHYSESISTITKSKVQMTCLVFPFARSFLLTTPIFLPPQNLSPEAKLCRLHNPRWLIVDLPAL